MRKRTVFRTLILAIMVFGISYTIYNTFTKDTNQLVKVGDVSPDFVLEDLDGVKCKLSDYKGKGVAKDEPVVLDTTQKEKDEEPIENTFPRMIDQEIASPIGESMFNFTYAGRDPLKISLVNTGTESFLYKILDADKETDVANGVLKSKESYEQLFDGLPEGDYVIYCVVEEEESPIDIKLKVKVEILR
ncbi:hypothetical protein ACQKM9_20775 [Viridibacillus sp. NPDC093762]|uniref:hypothetical protein n=1 Tax=Viridibacillus sp. NPDC093762 TaxID=3390720 RepID=UPI003CFF6299